MTEDEKYLEKIRNEYQQVMEQFAGEEQEEKERFRYLAKTMGYHSRLRLDYNRWIEDCLNKKDWPGLCRLIEQEVKYDLIPCIYGGYTHEAYIESTLEAFACGDTYTITAALPYKMGNIKNCNRAFYLAASNLLTALWYRDEEQIKDAVLAGEKFAARKTIPQWERAVVSFLIDLHTMDMEKASKDLLDVCKSYLRLKSPMHPTRPLCISAHGLYCLSQLLLPEESFLSLAMPEYKNFSKEFAFWRREHLEPDLTPYFQYPSELDWLNCIYQIPPTKLLLHQLQIDNPAIPPKNREDWTSDGVKMQKAFVEEVWENIQKM